MKHEYMADSGSGEVFKRPSDDEWVVHDENGDIVAYCRSEKIAEVLAGALNK